MRPNRTRRPTVRAAGLPGSGAVAVHGSAEAIGTDAGQGQHLTPPYPCHYYMHGAGRYGLQCLTNLDLLPSTGAVIFCAPLKVKNGSGSPIRALALVPEGGSHG